VSLLLLFRPRTGDGEPEPEPQPQGSRLIRRARAAAALDPLPAQEDEELFAWIDTHREILP
jgi:hypothetical protein